MTQRWGAFWSACALLASTFVAVAMSMSPANAAGFEDWAQISAGGSHTCGVRKNGKLYCWGNDGFGQVGDGDENDDDPPGNEPAPRRIGTFEDWSTVSAGNAQSCGVRRNGKLYCWGNDSDGQIGNGPGDPDDVLAPLRIGSFQDWSTVSTGVLHTCGIRHGGKLYCWGKDSNGQIGNGPAGSDDVLAPLRIGSFEDWSSIAAGGAHTCGIRHGGKLYCWGQNSVGQVGTGSTAGLNIAEPTRIGAFEDWARVSAGDAHSCGVRRNGKLYCWGNESDGRIGDGDHPSPAYSPTRIGDFLDWVSVGAGEAHTCGVRRNGKLYCWGRDSSGQVGDGPDETADLYPHRIGTFEDWSRVGGGGAHSCGIRHGGKLYCWGSDEYGQIGDGDATEALAPRRI